MDLVERGGERAEIGSWRCGSAAAGSRAYLEARSRKVGKRIYDAETRPEDRVYSRELGGAGGVARSSWVNRYRAECDCGRSLRGTAVA